MGKIKFSLLWFSKTKHQINCYCKTEKWEKLPSLCCHQEALPPLWNVAQNISGSSLYLNTWVRRWLWKLAGLYNRQDLRAINARANDYLSIEYCPEKNKQTQKQSRMKGEIRLGLHTSPHLPTLPGQGGDVYESWRSHPLGTTKGTCLTKHYSAFWDLTAWAGCWEEEGGWSGNTGKHPVWEWADMMRW